MLNFELKNPTKILFGKGEIAKISKEIPADAKVLMIYGGGSIKNNGVYDQVKEALKGEDIEDIKKKTEALVQASMKLGEAIYKSQQSAKPDSGKDDGGDNAGKKDENVVDADFEEVKDENKEKSA